MKKYTEARKLLTKKDKARRDEFLDNLFGAHLKAARADLNAAVGEAHQWDDSMKVERCL